MSIVAVDAGRTNCRAAVFTVAADGNLVRGASVTRPAEATVADPDGAARVAATVRHTVAELAEADALAAMPGAVLSVAAAGALRPAAAAALADQLAAGGTAGGGTAGGEVVATCDVVAAHAGAFSGGAGVVLTVGTGAVALAVTPGRPPAVVDGKGYLIGDAGGGFSIGRAGLAAAMRDADGRAGGSAALAAAAAARFVPEGSASGVPYVIHQAADPARQVASFVPDVADAARHGDPVAAAIWQEAVAELAETVTAACKVVPGEGCPVALVGTIFQLDDLLTGPLRARLAERCPQAVVTVDPGDALLGAAGLARLAAGSYGPLVVRRPA